MSNTSDHFPSSVQDKLFQTRRGDICLHLHEVWPTLLGDLSLLGPATVISNNDQLALVSQCQQLDFTPVPGSSEVLDLSSGLCLDTQRLGTVIAGREARTGNLVFHFFAKDGTGVFRVLLTPDSNLEAFVQLMDHYGKGSRSLKPQPTHHDHLNEEALANEYQDELLKTWEHLDPALGGSLLPGGQGLSWLHALRSAGRERALVLTKAGLMKVILAAHHDQLRLQMTGLQDGLHHETTLLPRRLERCGHCFHVLDANTEMHLFLDTDPDLWIGYHGKNRNPVIHLFSTTGQREGLIKLVGDRQEQETWHRALLSAADIAIQ